MTPLLSSALLRAQSDTRLASLAGDGHELAFEAIVERYRRPLHAYCRRVLPDARAEDVVQQTFISAWTALQRGDDVRELRAWLYRIAHNASVNALRRAGYDYDELRDSLEHDDTPEADLERRTVIRETLAGVASLPENQREALLRTAVGGSSQAEIARDLGVTDGAVRQLVHRARMTLRAAATAVTPFPLAAWAAAAGGAGGPAVTERIGELAAGAGTAGIGGLIVKGGTAVVVAGAIAAAPATVHHVRSDASARASGSPVSTGTTSTTTSAPAPAPAAVPIDDRGGANVTGRAGSGKDRPRHDGGDSRSDDHSGSGRSGVDGGEDHSGSGRSGQDRSGEDHGSGGSGEDRGSGEHGVRTVRSEDDHGGDGSGSSGSGSESGSGSGNPGGDDSSRGDGRDDGAHDGSDSNDAESGGHDGSGSDELLPHD